MLKKGVWIEGSRIVEGNIFRKKSVDVSEVQEVILTLIPKVTYDEYFIVLKTRMDHIVGVGELDPCFRQVVKLLEMNLPDFHLSTDDLEDSEARSERVIWLRSQSQEE